MININFNIRNPWSSRWKNYRCFHGLLPIPHKFWELQFYRSSDIIDLTFQINIRQSHGGVRLGLGLLTCNVEFQIYDNRHWDYENNTWENENGTV